MSLDGGWTLVSIPGEADNHCVVLLDLLVFSRYSFLQGYSLAMCGEQLFFGEVRGMLIYSSCSPMIGAC